MIERDRSRTLEAQRLKANQKAPEQIGHLIVTEEASKNVMSRLGSLPEFALIRPQVRRTEYIEPLGDIKIETMNQAVLLKISSKILVDGNSLRQIYETHLIGEHGLRRLVAEYNRGGDVKKALRKEIVEREIDFERDPVVRDMKGSASASACVSLAGSSAVLSQMISEAEAGVASQEEELAFYKAKAGYEIKEQHVRQKNERRTADIVIVSTVAFLITMIAILYLSRN